MEEEPLLKFLQSHQHTLQILTLQRVVLTDGGSWRTIITFLLKNHAHRLVELHLSSLEEGQVEIRFPIERPHQSGVHFSPPYNMELDL